MQREADLASHSAEEPNRRDFIVIAAQAFAGVGAAVALWPFIQPDEPRRLHPGAGLHRGRSRPRQGGAGHHRVVARQAGVHPQPHAPRRSRGAPRRQARRAVRQERPQRRPAREGARHRRQPHQEGQGELAGAGRHLHAPGLHPQGPVDVATPGATSAAGSAPATARTTTPRAASAKARRRATSRCRPTSSCPTPRSRSAEGPRQWPRTTNPPTGRPPASASGSTSGCRCRA